MQIRLATLLLVLFHGIVKSDALVIWSDRFAKICPACSWVQLETIKITIIHIQKGMTG